MNLLEELQTINDSFMKKMQAAQAEAEAGTKAVHEKFAKYEKEQMDERNRQMDAILAEADAKLKSNNGNQGNNKGVK